MSEFENLNDRIKLEHCLRFIVTHPPLAEIMLSADCRRDLLEAMETMFDAKSAEDTLRKVCDQVVVSTLKRVVEQFKRVVDDRKRLVDVRKCLDVTEVMRAVKRLENYDLGEEGDYIIMRILLHAALHFILSSNDVKEAWPFAKKMLLKGESVDESSRITKLRSEAQLLVKECVQKSLQEGPKAMVLHATKFEPRYPIAEVLEHLNKYTRTLSASLGKLWHPLPLQRPLLEDSETETLDDNPGGRKRARQPPYNSPMKKRKRDIGQDKLYETPADDLEVPADDDSDADLSGTSLEILPRKNSASAPRARERAVEIEWESPKRSAEAQESDDDAEEDEIEDTLTQSQKETLRNLDDATTGLKKVRGKDPLDDAVANSRELRRNKGLYHLSPNARDVTPIGDDDELSEGERARPRPSRTMRSRLTLASPAGTPRKYGQNTDEGYVAGGDIIRKGPFSVTEDGLLIAGLKKYGWSEWQRIASNCWNKMSYRRTATQAKDRARYLDKTARINRASYPGSYTYKRAGPPSLVNPSVLSRTPRSKKRRQDSVDDITDSDDDEQVGDDSSSDVGRVETAKGNGQGGQGEDDSDEEANDKARVEGDVMNKGGDDDENFHVKNPVDTVVAHRSPNSKSSKSPNKKLNGSLEKKSPHIKRIVEEEDNFEAHVQFEDPETIQKLRRSSRPRHTIVNLSTGRKNRRRGRK